MSIRDWAAIRRALILGDSYNSEVNAHFGNTSGDTDRTAAKNICLVQSNDSALIAQQRIRFFREEVQKTHLKPTIIGKPKVDVDADVTYHPQIFIRLWQDSTAVPRGKFPKSAEFSYRVMGETSETVTNEKLNSYARLVYSAFFQNQFAINKGKYIGWYISPVDGLHLQLYCIDEAECTRVAQAIVSKLNKTWSESLFKITKPTRSNAVSTTDTITILGQTKQRPQWRPNCTVRATEAWISLWAEAEEIRNSLDCENRRHI
ncbi:hypothetical protein [Nostoc sp.]|uniref:hypothetical protein n=1 Tax=Nostoc sp. TaxID=1180 RepID=UPI002FF88E84